MLVKSGAVTIEQLSEALSASSVSDKLPDGVPDDALRLCAEQVRLCASALLLGQRPPPQPPFSILETYKRGYEEKEKSFSIYGLAILCYFCSVCE